MRTALLLLSLVTLTLRAQDPAPVPLGTVVDAPFTDLRWQVRRLHELPATAATVVYFATIECPVVKRYLKHLGEIARDYAARGIVVLVVNVGPGDHLVDAAAPVTLAAPAAVFGKDFDGALARACGVDRTGAAVVLDAQRRIVYRGRIDDQHGYAGSREQPTRADLRMALDELLAGQPISTAATDVTGCKITWPEPPHGDRVPTFSKDIAPLLQKHCQECHRPAGEAPFPLLDEAQAKKHGAMLAEVTEQARMPPWYGSSALGVFSNHRGMTAAERGTFAQWVKGGMPSGEAADLPGPLPPPASGWRIGEPDLVVTVKSPVRLPAEGLVPYQYFLLPHRFDQDTWVEAIEIRPENRRVLHHCNLARVKFGEKFSQDGFITGYVPGGDPLVMDQGTAVRIPAGSALALQAHYVTTGEAEVDRLSVGFRFPRVVVQKEMKVAICADFKFAIPPGALAQPVRASRTLRDDAVGIGMFVHMHLRGRDMVVVAEAPDGTKETLLVVPNYNFDWQQSYRWPRAQKQFAKGTRFTALAHFDNSKWNPWNPDPTQTVKFGLETTDEMMYLFLFWVSRSEALGLHVDPANGRVADAVDGAGR